MKTLKEMDTSNGPSPGSRIRELRLEQGMRQAELAAAVGISPSYLNLIEHDRRRIVPSMLSALARALDLPQERLTAEVDQSLLDQMLTAANLETGAPEVDRASELALRYPGWAALIGAQSDRIARLEARVQELADRVTHDPTLAASLHEVIAATTAIRSTASILNGEDELDRDWQKRFHKNLHADAIRLAENSDALVTYLEAPEEGEAGVSPLQEAEDYLVDHDFHFPELEKSPSKSKELLEAAQVSSAALSVLQPLLDLYAADALALPLDQFESAVQLADYDPAVLSLEFDVPLAQVMRRLANLPSQSGHPTFGLVRADASGALLVSKHLPGLVLPRSGACPLWPLYTALGQPGRPVRTVAVLPGTQKTRILCHALAEQDMPRLNRPPRVQAMMISQLDPAPEAGPALEVGPACRICPRATCNVRREPSVISAAS